MCFFKNLVEVNGYPCTEELKLMMLTLAFSALEHLAVG